MRILTAHNYYQQSGGEDVVFATEQALLRDYGHGVIEYTDNNHRIQEMSRGKSALNTIWSRDSHRKLRTLLKKTRPDVAHFHNTFAIVSPSAYYACREAGIPVVQSLHNFRFVCPKATLMRYGEVCEACLGKKFPWPGIRYACYHESRLQTAVVSMMLATHGWLKTWQKEVDAYIALTEFSRQKFIEGGLPREKIVVKPNFVHPDPGASTERGDYALFVGRLSPEKGIEPLLEAWRRLDGVMLRMAGDGPLRNTVEKSQKKNIEIVGRVSHDMVVFLMQNARFLVFPSIWYEGFPLTIAEAFACGLPVIASNMGAMAEIVDDGRTGFHFQPGNAEDLAAKVEWAWDHPEEMEVMGREARREYETKFTAEKNYQMLMEIYKTAISSRG